MTEHELAKLLRGNPDLVLVEDERRIPIVDSKGNYSKNSSSCSLLIGSEHDLQVAIIDECNKRSVLRVEYSLIFAIPNGGHRFKSVAGKLKAEGVKAGVLDLFLPVARHGYHGLFLETKWGDNKPSAEQQIWMRNLRAEGYVCEVYWDFESGVRFLEWYLEG